MLVVDGTHLWGKYFGKVLIVLAMDGEHEILPIAFRVVDEEE